MNTASKKISALQVADYFIHLSNLEKKPITNKKLQKLVYYSQAWSLVLKDKKLFSEKIEAWVHGPAIPSLYLKLKALERNGVILDEGHDGQDLTDDQRNLLNSVWKIYGKYDGDYLEALSHSELPWQEARKDLPQSASSNNVISLATMKRYYARLLEQSQSRAQ